MTQYIAKRLGQTLLIVFLVSFLTFLLVAVMPKDPVYILYGTDLTPEEYEIAYKALGLDQHLLRRTGSARRWAPVPQRRRTGRCMPGRRKADLCHGGQNGSGAAEKCH